MPTSASTSAARDSCPASSTSTATAAAATPTTTAASELARGARRRTAPTARPARCISLVANPLAELRERLAEIADARRRRPARARLAPRGPVPGARQARRPQPRLPARAGCRSASTSCSTPPRGTLRQITIAPELPGAARGDRPCSSAPGVTVAVGHTEADFETTARAFDARGAHADPRLQRDARHPPPRARPGGRGARRRPRHPRADPRRAPRAPAMSRRSPSTRHRAASR